MDQALNSQKTPHTSPLRASYGMSFVSILMKNDRVIKGFYCTINFKTNHPLILFALDLDIWNVNWATPCYFNGAWLTSSLQCQLACEGSMVSKKQVLRCRLRLLVSCWLCYQDIWSQAQNNCLGDNQGCLIFTGLSDVVDTTLDNMEPIFTGLRHGKLT